MKQFVELGRRNTHYDIFFFYQFLFVHIHCHSHSGRAVAFADAALEHIKRPILNRELDVQHIAVVFFEFVLHGVELFVDFGHKLFEGGQVFIMLAFEYSFTGAVF